MPYELTKLVYLQLLMLFLAYILYCIMSTARVISTDATYFARKEPEWMRAFFVIGNILAMFQHWMYSSIYLDAGLVIRLYFGDTSPIP